MIDRLLALRASSELPLTMMDSCRWMKETCLKGPAPSLNAICELSLFVSKKRKCRPQPWLPLNKCNRLVREGSDYIVFIMFFTNTSMCLEYILNENP